jgi:pyroglutamyl-peptidase
MARPRVLITGFGPFPGVPDNPSSWLAEALAAGAAPQADAELHARVLPTEWQAVTFMPDLYAALQPTLMIHFGVCQRAKELRIERFAHNRAALRADARGALPPGPTIRPEGHARFDTELPAAKLAAHLAACGLPATPSRSAGGYLCNYLYYHSLDWTERNGSLALFVHIPPVENFGEAALLRAGREILRFTLAASPLAGEADRSLIGREGGKPHTQGLPLTPLPDPPPQGGRGRASLVAKG